MGQLRNTMDVNMPETAKMPVTASSAETRNKIGQLTKSIENISISSSTDDDILKKDLPGNLTETVSSRTVEENSNKGTICEAGLKNLCKQGKTCEFFHHDISQMPGCYMCLKYNTCSDKNCVWCVRGFCHNGHLCNNIYAQYLYYNEKDEYCSICGIIMEQKSRR